MFGNEEFGNSILALTSELTPQGRHIDLTLLKPTDRYASCHILFIGREDSRRYKAILGQIRDLPVLTVGETNDFLGAGGIVNFVFGETLQIDINAGAANRAHLKIRSALESMARHVTNMPGATETSKPKP